MVHATPSSCIMGFLPAQPPLTSPFFTKKSRTAIPIKAMVKRVRINPSTTINCMTQRYPIKNNITGHFADTSVIFTDENGNVTFWHYIRKAKISNGAKSLYA
jgi:hypothetical protein